MGVGEVGGAADRQALMIRATQGKMCLEQRGNWQLYITALCVFLQLFGHI